MHSKPTRDGFKQLGEHRDGCFGARDEDGIAFIVPENPEYHGRDRTGRRNPRAGVMWFRFRCNDTKCRAIMLVRWDVLARFVNGVDDA